MKKIVLIFLCICILFCGCSYGVEVDKQAFVIAVGVDKGEVFPLRVTFVFANPSASSGSSEGGGGGGESSEKSSPRSDIVTVEAPTVFSATRKLDSIKSKVINLSHTKVVVFSDEIAKSGVKNFLSGFASSRDFRPNTYVCVCQGQTQSYLGSIKPAQESNIEKYYDNIMHKVASDKVNEAYLYYLYFNIEEKSGGSLVPLVGENTNNLSNTDATINPRSDDFSYEAIAGEMIRDSKNPAEVLGGAIFKGDKMLGTLGSFKTDLCRIICDEYYPKNYSISYPDHPDFVTIRLIQQESPSIKTSLEKDIAKIDISIPVAIEYVDAGKIENDRKKSKGLCSFLAERLNQETKELLSMTQSQYKTDILGLGEHLKHHFPDYEKWNNFNWEEKYPHTKINVKFTITYADFEEAN